MHRFAVVAAVCSLAALAIGAMVTSSGGVEFSQLHEIVASVAAVPILILGIWMGVKAHGTAERTLGWTLVVLVTAAGGLGHVAGSPGMGILHALLGQILFAVTVAAATITSAAWKTEPDLVEDHGWPSLGSLGKITPFFVLLQIALGAAFRHKAMGVLPHLFVAMVLVLLILCVCIFVMQQFPAHKTLRPCANLLMAIAFTQIFLGIGAFTARTMTSKVTTAVIAITAAHAVVGGMTLAAAVVLAMQIRRNVYKRKSTDEE